jgi:hypothetical protein
MSDHPSYTKRIFTRSGRDTFEFIKRRLLFGVTMAVVVRIALWLFAKVRLSPADIGRELAILIGAYLIVLLVDFSWNLFRAPSILDRECTQEIERLKAELATKDEQATIGVELRECHLHPRLYGGFGKAVKTQTLDDPSLSIDIFVYVWAVSSFAQQRGIKDYSLRILTGAGDAVESKWIPQGLEKYHKDREDVVLDTFGSVSSAETIRDPLRPMSIGPFFHTVPLEGWLHFLIDEAKMSIAQTGKIIVTVKDSMGLCYEGCYTTLRDSHGEVWPNLT